MSGDPEQEYFADGISDDIITELSRFSDLFVIARNSSFRYKGKAVDLRQSGRELGVRYALEGSVRRGGNRVRINAQLTDAGTGINRWAEHYDQEIKDVFAIQDNVARTIAAIIVTHVNRAEAEAHLTQAACDLAGLRSFHARGCCLGLVPVVVATGGSIGGATAVLADTVLHRSNMPVAIRCWPALIAWPGSIP